MKKIVVLFLSLFMFSLPVYASVTEENDVTFNKCVDGDTAVLNIKGEKQKVRFLAVNTPESVSPKVKPEYYGKEASNYTCNALKSAKSIKLKYDSKADKTDKYGRILAWVYVDDNLLQSDLVSKGYAEVKYIYAKYEYVDELYQMEAKAKEQKLGIWSDDSTYKTNVHTVTFSYNGKEEFVSVEDGKNVNKIDDSKVDGYDFSGWLLDGKYYDFSSPVKKDITLVASYTKSRSKYVSYITGALCVGLAILSGIYKIQKKRN